jgi:hypothetical protein
MGHAVERVFQDYGDDFVVQTILDGEIAPIRIYVQVKGTQRMASHLRNGSYKVSVTLAHALKWARTCDLVVLALWDIKTNRGVWTLPVDQIDELDVALWQSRGFRFSLDPDAELTLESVQHLVWRARLGSYELRVNSLLATGQLLPVFTDDIYEASRLVRRVVWIMTSFLNLIGILNDHYAVRDDVKKLYTLLSKMRLNDSFTEQHGRFGAAFYIVISYAKHTGGPDGIPTTLAFCATVTLMSWLDEDLAPGGALWSQFVEAVAPVLFGELPGIALSTEDPSD